MYCYEYVRNTYLLTLFKLDSKIEKIYKKLNSRWILELPARLEQPIQHIQQQTFLPCFGLPSKTIVEFNFLAFFEILHIK